MTVEKLQSFQLSDFKVQDFKADDSLAKQANSLLEEEGQSNATPQSQQCQNMELINNSNEIN